MPDFGRWSANGGDPSLNEINRTDQFLDALATQQPVYATDHGEADLAQLLAGWRDDIRETPMEHVATPHVAEAALARVTSPAPRRRLSLAVVGSAAAAMLAIGGVGAVIAGSGTAAPIQCVAEVGCGSAPDPATAPRSLLFS
jgi:hypothetical protein